MNHNKFIRNIIVLISGTAGAQAIGILLSPLITRIYSPEALGVLGTFLAIQTIVNPVASLSYPLAIVLPKAKSDAIRLVYLSILFSIISFIVMITLFNFFGAKIRTISGLNDANNIDILLPSAVLLSAFIAIMTQWINRNKIFAIKAKAVMLQSVVTNVLKVVVGLLYPSALTLIAVTMIGYFAQVTSILYGFNKIKNKDLGEYEAKAKTKADNEAKKYFYLIKRYRDFAQYRTPQIALNAFSFGMPILLLASYFGPAAAGFYSLARSILGLPLSLIGEAVSSVFYPRVNEAAQKKEDVSKLLIKSTCYMGLIGIAPFGIIIVYGPYLFSKIFGAEWYIAGVYAQWMGLWLFSGFINRPAVAAIPVVNLQKKFLIIEVYSLVVRALGIFVGIIFFEDAIITVSIFSVVSFFVNLIVISMVITKSKDINKYIDN
ncbi:lipopolysaccharide biosynthesis protein [Cobetia marina]|uniref:lipopolysaccharide biosynthesis protein n=1 Tax=Cobetia marina TaxID=28258 RepID=UPI001144DDB0|nr:oligosaccharide flippase family protein [Cobetia marina]GED44021.1 polysaccharide biosynthesis protein [Cobetia marina]